MAYLVADRAGRRYRETRSSKFLGLCVRKLVENASEGGECRLLWGDHVREMLGEGEAATVEGKQGLLYSGADGPEKFFFVFTTKVLPDPPGADRPFEFVKRVYAFDPADGGRWRVLVECG